jgi:hypothetical protein
VAYLVRYHRGKCLGATPKSAWRDRQRKLRILLGLLRAADGLDSRCAPATAIVAKCKCQRLRIHCSSNHLQAGAHERLGAAKKFQLLERTLKLDVDVRVETILPEGAAAAD